MIMKEYKIALIKGDGIGPEVVDGAVKVMDAVSRKKGFTLKYTECLAGGCSIDRDGIPLTDETLNICKNSDAILLGAVGGPKWDDVDASIRPEKALLGLRKELGLYSNLRPALMYKALSDACPIKGLDSMDVLIVRELTGGIYFGRRGRTENGAFDTEEYSDYEIRRIVREGFRYAMGRSKRLTVVDKANVLETSRLWREIVANESGNFPEVSVEFLYIDNATMQLIGRPQSFDVIVTSNMFGDILSDEAGQITGSVGMLPSASLGDPGKPGMYEPVHGSAPDIAGKGIANPLATILSGAMMFKWSLGEDEAAQMINNAVDKVLEAGLRTADIYKGEGRLVTTEEMTSAVIEAL